MKDLAKGQFQNAYCVIILAKNTFQYIIISSIFQTDNNIGNSTRQIMKKFSVIFIIILYKNLECFFHVSLYVFKISLHKHFLYISIIKFT